MNTHRRSPWLTLTTILVYLFMYLPIVVLIVFSFNSSKINVVFEGVVNRGPCGPFYWYCQLFQNRDVQNATRNTLIIAFTSTIVANVVGTMAALALQRYNFRGRDFSETTMYFPSGAHSGEMYSLSFPLVTCVVSLPSSESVQTLSPPERSETKTIFFPSGE